MDDWNAPFQDYFRNVWYPDITNIGGKLEKDVKFIQTNQGLLIICNIIQFVLFICTVFHIMHHVKMGQNTQTFLGTILFLLCQIYVFHSHLLYHVLFTCF